MDGARSDPEEAAMGDKYATNEVAGADMHVPRIGPPPSPFAQEVAKFSNTVLSSATMGVLRALITPSPGAGVGAEAAAASSAESKVPAWMNVETQKENLYRTQMKNVMKDTVAFTAAAYLMEGVEQFMKMMRGGVDDFGNKCMGGVAAGGLLAQIWYPGRPQSRAILTSTGALVGYLSWLSDNATKKYLLDNQQRLEKEILHKRDDQVKKEVDMHLLRELVRLKQAAVVKEQQAKSAGLPQGQDPRPAGSYVYQSGIQPAPASAPNMPPSFPAIAPQETHTGTTPSAAPQYDPDSLGPTINLGGDAATDGGYPGGGRPSGGYRGVGRPGGGYPHGGRPSGGAGLGDVMQGDELKINDDWGNSRDPSADEWRYSSK